MHYDAHWGHTPCLGTDFHPHNNMLVPQILLYGEDPQTQTEDKWNRPLTVFPLHLQTF
jgi:hypothetical protein